ncbi:hypothetical protein Dda_7177 [Drechslerella dactyloides]|uniref:Uncharacterized protein n=1 Tax=Drechslerella dactyloides TaxID=74499 RepID=A0AAD6ITA3_DREDA|nr:hypothetical protein Dda_7177 [Drechslerella dactyloides]
MPSANISPNPAHATNALLKAIDAAPRHHLRLILQSLCTDPSTLHRAQALFSRLSRSSITSPSSKKRKLDQIDGTGSTPTKASRKRYKCAHCQTLFTPHIPTSGTESPCVYHPGNLLVDLEADIWTTISPYKRHKTTLTIDYTDEKIIERYPEGYRYDCCDEYADHEGCQRGLHTTSRITSAEQAHDKFNGENNKWKEQHRPAKRIKQEDTEEESRDSETDEED